VRGVDAAELPQKVWFLFETLTNACKAAAMVPAVGLCDVSKVRYY